MEVCTGAASIDEQLVLASLYDATAPARHHRRRSLLQATDQCATALTDLTRLTGCTGRSGRALEALLAADCVCSADGACHLF